MPPKYVAAYFLYSYTFSHGLTEYVMAAAGLCWEDEPEGAMGQFWRKFHRLHCRRGIMNEMWGPLALL